MSRQVVTVSLLLGLLVAASPVLAQRQRNPGGGGGERGGGQAGDGRPAAQAPSQDRGGRGGRPEGGRGYDQPRPSTAPPPQRPGSDSGRYGVPREQAYGNRGVDDRGSDGARGYQAPPRAGYPGVVSRGAPVAPRGNVAPEYADRGYANRGYAGRYVDPGYGVRPGYAVPRSYAAPRGYVAPRGFYGSRGHYGPPRYVSPGWRGSWGNGVTILTPRYVSPYVLGYGAWQPYYYRPSIGIGLYYGADGLYPFGAIPPVYYDPTPGAVYGGLRITDAPRDAQVFADGNYVGIVDDFDGVFQHLNLEPGQHRIEVHAPGYTPIAFDVVVQPGRTITLRADIY